MGGNDVHFGDIVTYCALPELIAQCYTIGWLKDRLADDLATLPGSWTRSPA